MMRTGSAVSYRVFVRNWWRHAGSSEPGWPGGLVPDPGARKTTLGRGMTEEEARQLCREYGANHEPGQLSRKAEYEQE